MRKKKNPEQEAEQATEQQEETQAETEETEEETQEQETAAETEEGTEDQAEEAEEESENQNAEEEQQEEAPAAEGDDENANLKRDLLQARGELAAYRAGVASDMVADAVTLAMAEAAKSGEVTETSVTKAMEAVLKRHPEWKAAEGGKQKSGGFKLGADRDNGGTYKKPANNANQNVKRWNRFK